MRRDPCNSNNSYARYGAPVGVTYSPRQRGRIELAGAAGAGPSASIYMGRRTRLAHVIDVFSATVASYILITLDWPLRASGALAPGSRPATIYTGTGPQSACMPSRSAPAPRTILLT